jgi:DNA repair ATPase RecN
MNHVVVSQNDQRFHDLAKRIARLLLAVVRHSRQHLEQLSALHLFHEIKLLRVNKRLDQLHDIGRPHATQQPHLIVQILDRLSLATQHWRQTND